ncbi:MAG: hypothetical protein KF752_13495 [Pirellulaceae bacterium]|nr:hypothetical protein [Pirellulaceae bacterium]
MINSPSLTQRRGMGGASNMQPVGMGRRAAVTVLEVLFATMVVIVGLIGIASIIPIAARNAGEANSHNVALSLGLSWADSFIARGFYQPSPSAMRGGLKWTWYRDFVYNGNPPGWQEFSELPDSVSTGSRLGAVKHTRTKGHVPVCIDPHLMSWAYSDKDRRNLFADHVNNPPHAYRASVFPYFDDGYDPRSSPIHAPSGIPDQPRMIRVTLAPSTDRILERESIVDIFGSVDELVGDTFIDPSLPVADRDSVPAERLFAIDSSGNRLKSLTEGRYTWMATVVPNEWDADIGRHALVSFVVFNRHDHQLNHLELPSARGERLTMVRPLSGNFLGGTGGRIELTCNSEVSDTLSVGDWLLLGRMLPFAGPTAAHYPYFRWYRIIATSGVSTISGTTWSREVVLEGPDFNFDDGFPTCATLVGGVVTVVERQVRLE